MGNLSSFFIYETTAMMMMMMMLMMPSPLDLSEQFLFFWSTCLKSKRFANVAGIFVLVYTEASIQYRKILTGS